LLKKLANPEDLIPLFPNGAYIGWSGFTGVGYPKYVWNSFLSCSIEHRGAFGQEVFGDPADISVIGKSQQCSRTM
jgi:acetyl-CoA hydrolase